MKTRSVLIKPVVTEKSTSLGEKLSHYVFVVDRKANKLQIKGAVEEMYGVTVEAVKTMVIPAKAKVRHTMSGVSRGRTNPYKKAVVSLAEGEVIDFYSSI